MRCLIPLACAALGCCRPVLLDRFPLLDSEGTRIENGISEFCFPSGLKLCRGMQMPKFFCFVLTDAEVSHLTLVASVLTGCDWHFIA